MNGNDKMLVDTSIFISLLQGNRKIAELLSGKILFYSFISEIELLGVSGISSAQQQIVKDVLKNCVRIGYSETTGEKTIAIKQKKKIKIPDAIIAASAIEHDIALFTADKDFASINELYCILFDNFT
jgi:predicted nucleic acid-binding protein